MRKFLFFMAVFVFPSTAFAADKTAYIRPACTFNGDGTASGCASAPTLTGAYNSCANAVTGEVSAHADLTTSGGNLILNASGATADTAQCIIDGFTTDSTHIVKLVGDYSGGAYSTAKYRIEKSVPNSAQGAIWVKDQYVEIDDIQLKSISTDSGAYSGIFTGSGDGGLSLTVKNSYIWISDAAGTGGDIGIFCRPEVTGGTCKVINDVIRTQMTGTGTVVGYMLYGSAYSDNGVVIAYNNTCYMGGFGTCLTTHGGGSNDSEYLKNNVANNCGSGNCYVLDAAAGYTNKVTSNNISSDTSSPDTSYRSKSCTFVSTSGGSEDFHLQSSDTNCKDAGISLVADAQFAFSTDWEGDARPSGSAWDIGADELLQNSFKGSPILGVGK